MQKEEDGLIVELLREVRCIGVQHTDLLAGMRSLEERLVGHIEREETKLDGFEKRFDALDVAFPDADRHGHRMYHEQMMKQFEQRARLRQAIIEKSLSSLAWAGIVAIGFMVWHAVRRALGLE